MAVFAIYNLKYSSLPLFLIYSHRCLTIMFQPLNRPQIEQIVRLQINGIQKMLNENGVTLRMTDEAVDFIATAGYDPEFGARPVKRAIQRYLLNDLSKKLLSQEVDRSKPIIVERSGDSLKFRN